MDRGSSSDDLIREAKAWADQGPAEVVAAPAAAPPSSAETGQPATHQASDPFAVPVRRPAPGPPSAPAPYAADVEPRRGGRSGFAVVVAILGLGLAGFFAFRALDQQSEETHIFSVTPGTCFQDPVGATVTNVEVVDCSSSHDLEAFAVVTLPYPAGTSLPADEELFGAAYDQCLPFFETYTGETYDTSRWYLDAFVPDRRGWKAGDRDALCVLFLTGADGSLVPSTESAGA